MVGYQKNWIFKARLLLSMEARGQGTQTSTENTQAARLSQPIPRGSPPRRGSAVISTPAGRVQGEQGGSVSEAPPAARSAHLSSRCLGRSFSSFLHHGPGTGTERTRWSPGPAELGPRPRRRPRGRWDLPRAHAGAELVLLHRKAAGVRPLPESGRLPGPLRAPIGGRGGRAAGEAGGGGLPPSSWDGTGVCFQWEGKKKRPLPPFL